MPHCLDGSQTAELKWSSYLDLPKCWDDRLAPLWPAVSYFLCWTCESVFLGQHFSSDVLCTLLCCKWVRGVWRYWFPLSLGVTGQGLSSNSPGACHPLAQSLWFRARKPFLKMELLGFRKVLFNPAKDEVIPKMLIFIYHLSMEISVLLFYILENPCYLTLNFLTICCCEIFHWDFILYLYDYIFVCSLAIWLPSLKYLLIFFACFFSYFFSVGFCEFYLFIFRSSLCILDVNSLIIIWPTQIFQWRLNFWLILFCLLLIEFLNFKLLKFIIFLYGFCFLCLVK